MYKLCDVWKGDGLGKAFDPLDHFVLVYNTITIIACVKRSCDSLKRCVHFAEIISLVILFSRHSNRMDGKKFTSLDSPIYGQHQSAT